MKTKSRRAGNVRGYLLYSANVRIYAFTGLEAGSETPRMKRCLEYVNENAAHHLTLRDLLFLPSIRARGRVRNAYAYQKSEKPDSRLFRLGISKTFERSRSIDDKNDDRFVRCALLV